jgi:hypothetical protein
MPVANTILRPDSTIVPEPQYTNRVDSTIVPELQYANRLDSMIVYTPIYTARADTYHTDVRFLSDSSNVLSDAHRLTADRTIVSEAFVGPQRRMPRYRIL